MIAFALWLAVCTVGLLALGVLVAIGLSLCELARTVGSFAGLAWDIASDDWRRRYR